MGVVSANQFNLGFDAPGVIKSGVEIGEQFRLQELQKKQTQFIEGGGLESPTAIQDAGRISIDFQKQVANELGLLDQRTGQIDQVRLNEAANFAFSIQNLPIERQNIAIDNRIRKLESEGRDAKQTRELLTLPVEKRLEGLQGVQLAALPAPERAKIILEGSTGKGLGKIQFGGQETFKDESGNIFFATSKRNPRTGNVESVVTPLVEGITPQGQLIPVSGSGITSAEKVTEAQQISNVKFTEKRRDALTKELADANRTAARSIVSINAALKLSEKASQGLTGSLKLQLGKIFPDIDVSNEGALQSAFTQLALVQLQSFKGPTTDFEFEKAQSVAGDLGDPKSANKARLTGLKRAAWFVRREFKQFRDFTKKGGDPDDFAFDFNETIQTKKGLITLIDLRDTAAEFNLTIEETIKRLNE
jgi:hypothetical protein